MKYSEREAATNLVHFWFVGQNNKALFVNYGLFYEESLVIY